MLVMFSWCWVSECEVLVGSGNLLNIQTHNKSHWLHHIISYLTLITKSILHNKSWSFAFTIWSHRLTSSDWVTGFKNHMSTFERKLPSNMFKDQNLFIRRPTLPQEIHTLQFHFQNVVSHTQENSTVELKMLHNALLSKFSTIWTLSLSTLCFSWSWCWSW